MHPPPHLCRQYLHSCGPPIIHRDLKSANLLVDKHWRVRVCDFNLSRAMEDTAVLSSVAATNPRWLAPEILSGKGYTFASDVYAFGCVAAPRRRAGRGCVQWAQHPAKGGAGLAA